MPPLDPHFELPPAGAVSCGNRVDLFRKQRVHRVRQGRAVEGAVTVAKQCRKQMNTAGTCVCPDCMRKRLPLWEAFWWQWHAANGFTGQQAEGWFQEQARQPWSVDYERQAA